MIHKRADNQLENEIKEDKKIALADSNEIVK